MLNWNNIVHFVKRDTGGLRYIWPCIFDKISFVLVFMTSYFPSLKNEKTALDEKMS